MKAYINGKLENVKLIERGSSTAPGCSPQKFPLYVERANGERLWVYDNEGDGRAVPGDTGPVYAGDWTRNRSRGSTTADR